MAQNIEQTFRQLGRKEKSRFFEKILQSQSMLIYTFWRSHVICP